MIETASSVAVNGLPQRHLESGRALFRLTTMQTLFPHRSRLLLEQGSLL
jgi:hypothetical protein